MCRMRRISTWCSVSSTPSQSYPDYLDLRDRNRTFESMLTFNIVGPVGVDTGGIRRLRGRTWRAETTSTRWEFSLIWGGSFTPPMSTGNNSAPYVVLSYAYWHGHFHDDAGVVGRTVQINKHPHHDHWRGAAGVSRVRSCSLRRRSGFRWSSSPRSRATTRLQYRGNHSEFVVGRLKPGVTRGAGDGGPECPWRVAGQDLSGRRRWREVHAGASRAGG